MTFLLRRFLFASRSPDSPVRFLVDEAALAAAMDRERMRTDRTSSPFCLVLFRAEDGDAETAEAALIGFLCKRLRTTDAVGRWRGVVAALLVDTPQAGGERIVDEAGEATGVRWTTTVRCYPDDALDSDEATPAEEHEHATPRGPSRRISATASLGEANGRASDAKRPPSGTARFFLRELCPPIPIWKRTLDVVGAAVGLALLSPILVAATLAIKFGSPGPILFAQRRTGRGGVPFTMYKFRTMVVDAESQKSALRSQSVQDGPAFKLDRDPRVTRIGTILRKSCIDELPQLWNVLRGDMSIVGPRPLPVDEAAKCEDWQQRRHAALPGLTCHWQAMGSARVPFREWMRLDIRYVGEISPWIDLRLIVRTLTKVVLARASR